MSQIRVLIVDDEASVCEVFEMGLRKNAFAEVQVAQSVEDAIEVIANFTPQVVVMDIRMPGYDGCVGGRLLKGMFDAPIVYVSGYASSPDIQRTIAEQGDILMLKPVTVDKLRSTVKIAWEKSMSAQDPAVHTVARVAYDTRGFALSWRGGPRHGDAGEMPRQRLSCLFGDGQNTAVAKYLEGNRFASESARRVFAESNARGASLLETVISPIKLGDRVIAQSATCTRHVISADEAGCGLILRAHAQIDLLTGELEQIKKIVGDFSRIEKIQAYVGRVADIRNAQLDGAGGYVRVEFARGEGLFSRLFPVKRLAQIGAVFEDARIQYTIYECGGASISTLEYIGPPASVLMAEPVAELSDEQLRDLGA